MFYSIIILHLPTNNKLNKIKIEQNIKLESQKVIEMKIYAKSIQQIIQKV